MKADTGRPGKKPEAKKKTREAAFKKQLALEREARAARLAASSGSASTNGAPSTEAKRAAVKIEKTKLKSKKGKSRDREKYDKPTGGGFKYKSFNERLNSVKLDRLTGQTSKTAAGLDPLLSRSADGEPSNKRRKVTGENQARDDDDDQEDTASSMYTTGFGSALFTWRELNLSLAFVDFSQKVSSMTASLPLLMHHRDDIADLILSKLLRPAVGAPTNADKEPEPGTSTAMAGQYHAYAPAFDLLPRLALDLGGGEEFAPIYPRLLKAVLHIAAECSLDKGNKWTGGDAVAASDIVEQAFSCATALIKVMSTWMLDQTAVVRAASTSSPLLAREQTWEIFREYLGYIDTTTEFASAESRQNGESADQGEDGSPDEEVEGAEEDGQEGDDAESEDEEDVREASRSVSAKKHGKKVSSVVRRFACEAFAHLVRTAASHANSTNLAGDLAQMMLDNLGAMMAYQTRTEESLQEVQISEGDAFSVAVKKATSAAEKARALVLDFALGIAGIWTEACKSVDNRLHSDAPTILRALLLGNGERVSGDDMAVDEASQVSEAQELLGKLCFVNLAHHSKVAHFGGMVNFVRELVKESFEVFSRAPNQNAAEQLSRKLSWLCICIGVRKGSRIEESAKPELFGLLRQMRPVLQQEDVPDSLRDVMTIFTVLSIPSGRIQDQVGPITKFLNELSTVPTGGQSLPSYRTFDGIMSSLGSAEIGWAGFRQFAFPIVVQHSNQLLMRLQDHSGESGPRNRLFSLLSELDAQGHLQEAFSANPSPHSAKFRIATTEVVEKTLQNSIETLSNAEAKAQLLADQSRLDTLLHCCGIVPLIAKHQPAAVKILDELTGVLATNSSSHKIVVLQLLRDLTSGISSLRMDQETKDSLQSCRFMHPTQSYLLAFLGAFGLDDDLLLILKDFAEVLGYHMLSLPESLQKRLTVENLRVHLMSHDPALRLASLQTLNANSRFGEEAAYGTIVEELLSIESTPLTVENIRARVVKLRKVARSIINIEPGQLPAQRLTSLAKIVVDYVVSSLKLNFRPLWQDSIHALIDLAAKFPEAVWESSFGELTSSHASANSNTSVLRKSSEQVETPSHNQLMPIERFEDAALRDWCDPQLAAKTKCVAKRVSNGGQRHEVLLHVSNERLDLANYRIQILKLLSELSSLVHRHNAPFVAHFMSIKSALVDSQITDKDVLGSNSEQEDQTQSTKERLDLLAAYLKVFGALNNPKALSQTQHLHRLFLALCAAKDKNLQQLALKCILTWKDPSHVPYQENLTNLLEPSKQRDELINFSLEVNAGIQNEHRKDLIPLVIRLLFGQMTSTRGKSNAGAGLHSRRTAMLSALAACKAEELETLCDLMLASFNDEVSQVALTNFVIPSDPPRASHKQQKGFLAFLSYVVKQLAVNLVPHWHRLISVLLIITIHANRKASTSVGPEGAPMRSLRQEGLKRLNQFFNIPQTAFDWTIFQQHIFDELITPRLESMPIDSVESPSAVQELIVTWASKSHLLAWLMVEPSLIPSLFRCLSAPTVKDPVTDLVITVMERLCKFSSPSEEDSPEELLAATTAYQLKEKNASEFLGNVSVWCNQEKENSGQGQLFKRIIDILIHLQKLPSISDTDASLLFESLVNLMRKGKIGSNETLKAKVFQVLRSLIPRVSFEPPSRERLVENDTFPGLVVAAFSSAQAPVLRQQLSETFASFVEMQGSLAELSGLVQALNAYQARNKEQPDFDRRLEAFNLIEQRSLQTFMPLEWQVLLHNMSFFVQDSEETAIRSPASSVIQRFILQVVPQDGEERVARDLFSSVVIPAIKRAQRSRAETVRREGLMLLADAVNSVSHMQNLRDLKPLLANGDQEASFFANAFHIQLHRRIRAFQRLSEHAAAKQFGNGAVMEYLVPIIEQTIGEASKNPSEHNLLSEVIRALGSVSSCLRWGSYLGLLNKHLRQVKERSTEEKPSVRAVLSILEAFPFDLKAETEDNIVGIVKKSIIPTLIGHLDQDANAEDQVRLPIAMGVVFIVRRLPEDEQGSIVVNLFRTLSNILKAKAQETRDLAREMVLKVQSALALRFLTPLIEELRKTLSRGTQKATLAYVLHAILVQVDSAQPVEGFGVALTRSATEIAMDDLFGRTAEDRVTAAGKHKAREMKQSKSLDTIELVGKNAAVHALRSMLEAIKEAMSGSTADVSATFEQLFRRLSLGLSANARFDKLSIASISHSLITQRSSVALSEAPSSESETLPSVLRKRKDVERSAGVSTNNPRQHAFHFILLGLDLLGHAMRKGKYDFSDGEDLARLDALVGPVGNTIHADEVAVISTGLRTLAEMAKAKLPSLHTGFGLLVKQIMAIVQRGGSLQGELSQSALKTLSALLRESSDTKVMERDLSLLLEWTAIDLEEPAIQSALFAFLRVLMNRKLVSPALYDVMDKVALVMITNQSGQVREACRSLYLQFLLEFPQGKGRLKNQLNFLASNLSYEFESGRLSVLELLRAILTKVDQGALKGFSDALFVALVMMMANDDSSTCRAKAAALLKTLSEDLDTETIRRNMSLTKGWASNMSKPGLVKVGLQVLHLSATTAQKSGSRPDWVEETAKLSIAAVEALAVSSQSSKHAADASAEALNLLLEVHAQSHPDFSSLESFARSEIWLSTLAALLAGSAHLRTAAAKVLEDILVRSLQQGYNKTQACSNAAIYATKHFVAAVKAEDLTDSFASSLQRLLVYAAKILFGLSGDVAFDDDISRASDADQSDEEGDVQKVGSPLSWWFSRVSFSLRGQIAGWNRIGANKDLLARKANVLIGAFDGIVHHLPTPTVTSFLSHILQPLCRFLDDSVFPVRSEDKDAASVRTAAEKLQENVRSKVGVSAYVETFSKIRQGMLERRKQRKTAQLMEGMNDPEAAEERRAAKNAAKRQSRKKRIDHLKKGKVRNKALKH